MTNAGPENVFETGAEAYDAWYDTPNGQALFATEAAALRDLLQALPRPHLEVGVGTGRFARLFDIDYGLDPAAAALKLAQRRGLSVVRGLGETLPFRDTCIGGVLIVFTLCFAADPERLLREVRRVLRPDGGLVLGLLLKGTPWADSYSERAAAGHPIYSTAHFYRREEIEKWLRRAGLCVTCYRSTLFQPPGLSVYRIEEPVDGFHPQAGFTVIGVVPR
jgi:ubiquinone/menaquinone biosynthesis C-methylase UbiE